MLTYHAVAGDYTTTKLRAMILADGGVARLETGECQPIGVMMSGSGNLMEKDATGGTADITAAGIARSNGVIQAVDHVLMA